MPPCRFLVARKWVAVQRPVDAPGSLRQIESIALRNERIRDREVLAAGGAEAAVPGVQNLRLLGWEE